MEKNIIKKSILKKNFKNVFLSLIIGMLILPFVSIKVNASENIKVLKAETVIPISLDGKESKNIRTVKYTKDIKEKRLFNKLGENSEEPLPSKYDNRSYINSANQGKLGLCWAFGNKNLIESFLSKQKNIKMQLSARHMDYALSNVVPDSINRNPGTEADPTTTFTYFSSNKGPVKEVNFPYNTDIENPSIEDLEKNIEDLYLEGYKGFPSIQKEIKDGKITYDLVIAGALKIEDVSEEEILDIRHDLKRYIRDYGSISAGFFASTAVVEYPSEEFMYNDSTNGMNINHNISIIGWDDNFCKNNPGGSISGKEPINSGAWLVSDSNQPKGNQFYYIAYDDVFVENLLIGVNDISIGSRFNTYMHDLIGFNSLALYSLNDVQDLSKTRFVNVYEKTGTDVEFLNKVGFITMGNVKADVYYAPIGAEGYPTIENFSNIDESLEIRIGSINEDRDGIFYNTIDIKEPIEISKGKFAVYLKITDNPGLGKMEENIIIPIEKTESSSIYKNIKIKNQSYIIGDEVNLSKYNFIIRAYTSSQVMEDEDDTFLVSYDLQGGSGDFPSVRIKSGNYIENSQIPTKKGYEFVGWTPDPKTTAITKNTTFVANWKLKTSTEPDEDNTNPTVKPDDNSKPTTKPRNTATFVIGDGNIEYVEIGEGGYVKNIPTPKAKEGYKFIGWNPNPKETKANEDTVFYALWEKLGNSNTDDGKTTIDYTKGTKNDGTQANIKLPNAGKSITIIFIMLFITTTGIIFYIKYKKIDV